MSHLVSIFVDKKTQPGEDTIFLLVYTWGEKKELCGSFLFVVLIATFSHYIFSLG